MRIPPFVPGPTLPDGRVPMGVYPLKQHIRPYWLLPRPTELTLSGAGAFGEMLFLVDEEGHFEWTSFINSDPDLATDPMTHTVVELFDPQKNRRLMNRPVHIRTISAVSDLAFRLPEPYLFNVGGGLRTMNAIVRKLNAGSATYRLAMLGRRYYHVEAPPAVAEQIRRMMGDRERAHTYFMTYNEVNGDGSPPTIAAGGTGEFTFQADDDADSDLTKLMVPAATGDFSFALREEGSNRRLSNGVIHSQQGWGTGEFPFNFSDTYLLERSKKLIFEVTNLSGEDLQIYATIAGRRLMTEAR